MPGEQRLLEAAVDALDSRTSRRGLLVRAALVGSALTVAPLRYVLRPGSALAAIQCVCHGQTCANCSVKCCTESSSCFCCVFNNSNGVNNCPSNPATGRCGWWYCSSNGITYIDCCRSCGEGCHCCAGQCNNRLSCCNQSYGNCTGCSSYSTIYCRITRRNGGAAPACCSGSSPPPSDCSTPPACAQV